MSGNREGFTPLSRVSSSDEEGAPASAKPLIPNLSVHYAPRGPSPLSPSATKRSVSARTATPSPVPAPAAASPAVLARVLSSRMIDLNLVDGLVEAQRSGSDSSTHIHASRTYRSEPTLVVPPKTATLIAAAAAAVKEDGTPGVSVDPSGK